MELTNTLSNLDNLIPLGTIVLRNAPRLNFDCLAPDGWRWLTFPHDYNRRYTMLCNDAPQNFSSILMDIRYLVERFHIRVTYKYFPLPHSESIIIARIYVIPADCEGRSSIMDFRYRYRRGKALQWHENKYRKIMSDLFQVLDFSGKSWDIDTLEDVFINNLLIFPCLKPWEPFSSKFLGSGPYFSANNSLYHNIHRLIKHESIGFAIEKVDVINGVLGKTIEDVLLDIYDNIDFLDSNHEQMQKLIHQDSELKEIISAVQNNDTPGIKSNLYNYQKQSVSEMIIKELAPSKHLMPNLVKFLILKNENIGFDSSRNVYLDLLDFCFKNVPEYFDSVRGGILAENMGLGKTCICLALVCSTKTQVSRIPQRFYPMSKNRRFKKLSEIAANSVNKNSIAWKQYVEYLPSSCIELLLKHPATFTIPESLFTNRRQSTRLAPQYSEDRTLFLSLATLIVVPNNLYYQWISEIKKHCFDDYLSVLYVPYHTRSVNADYIFPSAQELIKYDVVLMGVSSFVKSFDSDSPLKNVYWKRFIVDEGHTMSSKITRLVQMASELHVERRWLVSGTPTSGLTKLHVSEQVHSKKSEDSRGSNDTEKGTHQEYAIKRKFSAKDDLNKLGLVISNFFKIEPWAHDASLFTRTLIKPFLTLSYGSVESLSNLLTNLLIRHSIKTVEKDIVLPFLYHQAVFVEPAVHNKISINLFIAVLAANAVTSERTDQDYMFHPVNRSSLKRLITNLQRSTFHWVGFSQSDITTLVKICQTALDKKREGASSQYHHTVRDRVLLRKCIDAAHVALDNKIWKLNASLHEMSFFVEGLPSIYAKNYCVDYLDNDPTVSVYPYMQLNSIQKFFFKNRFVKDHGKLKERISEYSKTFWKGYWKTQDKKIRKLVKKNDSDGSEITDLEALTSTPDPKVKTTVKPHHTLTKKRKRADILNDSVLMSSVLDETKPRLLTPVGDPEDLSLTRNANLLGTASAKLSYLASRLLDHHVTGAKSIIFYQFEDSAYYLVELLDLLGLNYILYSTSIPVLHRNSKLLEFDEHRGAGITLIMDLKLAAHGLTILGATRMYFINPVWKKAIEAQAIKRCHRIGQTKDVYVETLILKGTLEEEMYKRRLHSDDSFNDNSDINKLGKKRKKNNDSTPSEVETDISEDVYDDNGMRQYFEAHEFLAVDGSECEYAKFSSPAILSDPPRPILVDTSDFSNTQRIKDDNAEATLEGLKNYELLKPIGMKDCAMRNWKVPLFTQTALEKINASHLKINTFINEEEVMKRSFGVENEQIKTGNMTELRKAVRKPKKVLRFE